MLKSFAYARPATLDDAVARLTRPGARACAGGTDLLGCLRDEVFDASTIVSLRGLERLRGIDPLPNGTTRIGALTSVSDIARSADLGARYAALSEAASMVASPQLRNQGTIGGNICQRPRCWFFRGDYPCTRKGGDVCFAMQGDNRYHCIFGGSTCLMVHPSDMAPALVALGAEVRVVGPKGQRSLLLEQLFLLPEQDMQREVALEPGEILQDVVLPPPPTRSAYRKVRARGSWDFALSGAAVALVERDGHVESARIVLSGVAPVPWPARAAERVIAGASLDDQVIRRAADAAVEGAQPLDHNGYKVALTRGIVEEVLASLAAPRG